MVVMRGVTETWVLMVVVLVLSVSLFGEFKIVEHAVGCSATMSLQKKM
jgi:hypothetical protein